MRRSHTDRSRASNGCVDLYASGVIRCLNCSIQHSRNRGRVSTKVYSGIGDQTSLRELMTTICPTCEDEFDTKHAMRIHHYGAHDERLPNRTCRSCGMQFYDDMSKQTYCKECDPPTTPSGKDNPNWKGGKPEKSCDYCGETYRTYRDNQFCSRDCFRIWWSERMQNDGNPMWSGGVEVEYTGSWAKVRRRALERDNHTCQSCGTTRDEIEQEPDVHHIIPVREHDDPELAHRLDNVICLCRRCHRKVEVGNLEIASAQG